MDQELKREIIMENYLNPTNRKRMNDNNYQVVNTRNASCIDNLDIYIKVEDNIIKDITFDGEACAISISSTSIMINNLIGKTLEEALDFIHNFYQMTEGKDYNQDMMNEALAYNDIYKQGNRKTCATLPYRGLEKAILDLQK